MLVFHHYVGLPLPEVADRLGIPVGTAKSRLHRATNALRASLEADARTPQVAGATRMTARRDPDRLIRAYLDDGPAELPDRSFDAVRAHMDHQRQRVVIGPWRIPLMSNVTRFAIAAAAIVVVAVIALNLLPKSGGIGGPAVTPTPSPSPSPSASPSPTFSPSSAPAALAGFAQGGPLAAGTYYIENQGGYNPNVTRLTFTLPAGWAKTDVVGKDPETTSELQLGTWIVSHIFTDVCQWSTTSIVDVGTTADQLVTALADQHGRTASAVTDTTVAGFPAKRIELTVSPTLDTATCTSGILRYWPDPGPDFAGGMCCTPAGATDVIYAADIAGKRLLVVARHYPGSTSQNLAELQSIVDSIQIEP